MSHSGDVLAVIFDFDNTLMPDSITKLLVRKRIDPEDFWLRQAGKLVRRGYDQIHAYLNVMLKNIGQGKPLGPLTNVDLLRFGSTLDKSFYPGLPRLFDDLKRIVGGYSNITIEFYIISGGLQEIIEGSKVVDKYFDAVYGSQLAGDTPDGVLKYVKRAITFTEKTRYLFEINKGVRARNSHREVVNEDIPYEQRRIPFSNMFYIGDGFTDIPCLSLVQKGVGHYKGGMAIGIFDPSDEKSARRSFMRLLLPRRVVTLHAPRYGPKQELGSLLRVAVTTACSKIRLRREQAYKEQIGPVL